ncbi:hypothetical protein DM860_001371 [Cuscuta australis]|uniref:cytokinin riboside 5'-monophosphate phosphoribohydrolase n=1 Tax=Cuscuta australis TaxID=267555 RepID=A0A328ECD7_9ASTE|nr:hypothetical protein DM860_001371 [Cuscuta australis]
MENFSFYLEVAAAFLDSKFGNFGWFSCSFFFFLNILPWSWSFLFFFLLLPTERGRDGEEKMNVDDGEDYDDDGMRVSLCDLEDFEESNLFSYSITDKLTKTEFQEFLYGLRFVNVGAMSLTIPESQYVMSSVDCSIGEYVLVWGESTFLHALGSNPRFMATAVDLGRELVRRKIRLTYGGGNVGLQGAVASTVYNNGGRVRGFIPGYIATRGVYGPAYGAEYTVSRNYYKYFEMNHIVEAFIVLPGGIDTIEGLFTLISWASEGLHSRPIGLLNIDGYFNNLIKFLDDAVRQNFMASNQRKLFISSFFVDELLDKLEFAKAFLGPGASYEEFANPGSFYLEVAAAFLDSKFGNFGWFSCSFFFFLNILPWSWSFLFFFLLLPTERGRDGEEKMNVDDGEDYDDDGSGGVIL